MECLLNIQPPHTKEECTHRAEMIAGMKLAELAQALQETVPTNTTHAKGWVGQLIEKALGAQSGSQPLPDFPGLGIEIKTVPVDEKGTPFETTYVCTAPLTLSETMRWEKSVVRDKLKCVLWVPYQGIPSLPLNRRLIGFPLLWHLDAETESILTRDFEELVELILNGKVEYIRAELGAFLHIRPKAARGSSRTKGIGEEGQIIKTLPRGFYLRKTFTEKLFKEHFL